MEVLRSTEVLDKEIRAECQKKAVSIIENAQKEADSLITGVDDRVKEAENSAENKSRENLELFRKNVNASLPLEKQRYLVSYIHESIIEAMNNYFEKMPVEKRLALLEKKAGKAAALFAGKKIDACYTGYPEQDAEKFISKNFGSYSLKKADVHVFETESLEGLSLREGFIIKAEDNSVSLRLTPDECIKDLLEEKTYELAEVLFAGRVPE